ncbi:MAG: hemerythrin domain-containing protein [Spirochaetales bacterium]|nr:hemerythrin domain-containing protein [Spirochaetales bacterium]
MNRFVPQAALRLLGTEDAKTLQPGNSAEVLVTLMFVDLRNFSSMSEAMEPDETLGLLNEWFGAIEPVIAGYGGYVDKYIGDALLAVFPEDVEAAVSCAVDIVRTIDALNKTRSAAGKVPLGAGIGINTGFVALGVVGAPHRIDVTIVGDAVNIAARMENATKVYGVDILISENTIVHVRHPELFDFRFVDRILVRGKMVPLSIYEVFSADPETLRLGKQACRSDFDLAMASYHYQNIPEARHLLERCLATSPQDGPAALYLKRCERYEATGEHECAVEMKIYPVWSREFAIGHAVIDQHHQKLFKAVALLMRMIDEESFEKTGAVIEFLDRYIDVHFKTEESLMRACGYPFYDNHKSQHDRFRLSFKKLVGEVGTVSEHQVYTAFRTHLLVVDWLLNHTTRMDPHLGRYLGRATSPLTP